MKPNQNNPFSPDYRPPDPKAKPADSGVVGNVISVLFLGLLFLAFQLAAGVIMLSLMYGVVLLVFRHAFGVELPNPYNWIK